MRGVVRHHGVGVVARITGGRGVAAAATAAAGGEITDLHRPPPAERKVAAEDNLLIELVRELLGTASFSYCAIGDDLMHTCDGDLVRGRGDSEVRRGGARAQQSMTCIGLRVLVMNGGVFPDLGQDERDAARGRRRAHHQRGGPHQADATLGVTVFAAPRSPRLRSRQGGHQRVLTRRFSSAPNPIVPPPPPPKNSWNMIFPKSGSLQVNTIDGTSYAVKFDVLDFVRVNPLAEKFPILGEPGGLFTKLREPVKFMYNDLILRVGAIHDSGCCINDISAAALVITSDWKLEFREDAFVLLPKTPTLVDNNYRCISELFKTLLFESMGEEFKNPLDFQRLLDTMEKSGYHYKRLIENHMSLMPLDNTSTAYLKFYQLIKKVLPVEEEAIRMRDRMNKVKKRKRRKSLITRIYEHITVNKLWMVTAVNNAFVREFLERGGKVYQGKKGELLDMIRHLISHRMELIQLTLIYTPQQVDLMIYALFSTLYTDIQHAIFEVNRLEDLNLEEHFMNRKVKIPWVWRVGVKFIVGYSSLNGRDPYMEDRFNLRLTTVNGRTICLCGVFDGHGGPFAANYLKKNLLDNIGRGGPFAADFNIVKHSELFKDTKLAISQAFLKTDADFLDSLSTNPFREDVSTAAVAVLIDNHLYVANVGDSCAIAVKSGEAIPLTPNRKEEQIRIEDEDIQEILVDQDVEFLVLATNGLWDVMRNEDVVSVLKAQKGPESAAMKLTEIALSRGSLDNITCIILQFQPVTMRKKSNMLPKFVACTKNSANAKH
uniref:protein-serine/threonine phosphatase n=1 Tax=Oryza barthii TaxID=65489 RepID=A0A0D3F0K6_9ORYZ